MYRFASFFLLILLIANLCPAVGFPSPLSQTELTGHLALSEPLTVRWQYDSEQTINLTPATAGERVYLPLAAGTIISLRSSDGQLFWKADIGG